MLVAMRCLVILSLLLLPACADRAKHSESLYAAGDYAGAARAADEGLSQDPADEDLWGMRIRAALALGDADGVARTYEAYVGHRGGTDKALLRDLSTATLGQALASPSARLKIIAIDAIEELEVAALADRVAERMGDDDDRVAASAAIAVIHGYPQAPGVADDMMRSENPEARRIAVDGVGKKIGKLAVADLEKAGSDGDPRVRAAALHWLGMLKDADAVELCTKRLHDRDDSVRAAAASALARIGLGNLESLGKRALKDTSLAVRLAGIELLVAAPSARTARWLRSSKRSRSGRRDPCRDRRAEDASRASRQSDPARRSPPMPRRSALVRRTSRSRPLKAKQAALADRAAARRRQRSRRPARRGARTRSPRRPRGRAARVRRRVARGSRGRRRR